MSDKDDSSGPQLDRWQRAAILMVTLGQNPAAELLSQFEDDEVEHITRAFADLKNIPKVIQDEVVAEFEDDLKSGHLHGVRGGHDVAHDLLQAALGLDRADQVMQRLGGSTIGSGFRALDEADPTQVAPYIRREHPQTIALVMTQLRPEQAAAILENLPHDVQTDVAHRIATLESVSPEVLQEVEEGLKQTLQTVLTGGQQVDGVRVAADILNRVGTNLERELLSRLDAADPEVADEVRQRMFTFDDISRLADREIIALLENVELEVLKAAMKTAGKGVLDRILSNMSSRRRGQWMEDIADLPKMRLRDVEDAQAQVVQTLRQLESRGVVDLSSTAGDDDRWV
ncbi:MAG: flagellar motor switch protein FliG [Candidatus Latescibacterota bacterium]|nr:flagellar motor switch protein FliG [Candidatus Latescibacterota bacterium]